MIKAPDVVTVSATAQTVTGFYVNRHYTLRNTGTSSLYYVHDPDTLSLSTTFTGTAVGLRTLGGSELRAGEAVILEPPLAAIMVARGSDAGDTTLQIECGSIVAPRKDALAVGRVIKAVVTPSTALPLVTSSTIVRACILQARKAAGTNTGAVFVGISTEDQGVLETIELSAGDSFTLPIPAGETMDLTSVYVDADNAADGVVGLYWADA